jgi:hypothetical protein
MDVMIKVLMLSEVMLNVIIGECHYAECRGSALINKIVGYRHFRSDEI